MSIATREQRHVSIAGTVLLEMHRNLFRLFGDRTLLVPEGVLAAIGGEVAGVAHPQVGGAVIATFAADPALRQSDEFVLIERARQRLMHRAHAAGEMVH